MNIIYIAYVKLSHATEIERWSISDVETMMSQTFCSFAVKYVS